MIRGQLTEERCPLCNSRMRLFLLTDRPEPVERWAILVCRRCYIVELAGVPPKFVKQPDKAYG